MNESQPSWVLLVAVVISGCAAFRQTSTEVTIREPGHRMLGEPQPIRPEATKDWEYAWLSEAAYRKTLGANHDEAVRTGPCAHTDADAVLEAQGWQRWTDFPAGDLSRRIDASHLRVEVWEHRAAGSVVVAFGGTTFKSGKDWKSNLRWFIPFHKDEYTELVGDFGPAFVAEFQRRGATPDGSYLKRASLYATGHSLGGGLAQQFAYALPLNPAVRVKHVFAFDPSPVTGFFSVDPGVRDANKRGLSIDRIYERGEILALVRSFTSFFLRPSASDPAIRGVRYALFYPANPIAGHSMLELACKLQAASGH